MRIDERLAGGPEPSFSFEFFPPRTDEGERNLGRALAELSRMDPTFVSVTYGAGGNEIQKRKTVDIVSSIKAEHGLEAMAHFTCVGATIDPAARDARPDARRGDLQRARAARRPAARRDRVDRDRRRAHATRAS